MFCDVSKIVVNSKILIVSGTPIRVIFQNSVTNTFFATLKQLRIQLQYKSCYNYKLNIKNQQTCISKILNLKVNRNLCYKMHWSKGCVAKTMILHCKKWSTFLASGKIWNGQIFLSFHNFPVESWPNLTFPLHRKCN